MASIQAEVKKERELNALKAAQEAKLAALKAPKEPKAPKVHKTKFRRLSPSTKLIYILSIGLIISLMFSYMYVSSPKGVYGIQLWLGNLAFWTKDPTKVEGGVL